MRVRLGAAGPPQRELANSAQDSLNEQDVASSRIHSAPVLGLGSVPLVRVLAAFSIIACTAVVTQLLELSVTEEILVAGIRCFVQLSCLGMILQPVFAARHAVIVLGYAFFFMVPLASYEAATRSKLCSPNIFFNSIFSLGSGVLAMTFIGLLILAPKPWYDARHLIPLVGMLINNCMACTTFALDQMLDHLVTQKDYVELMLCFGAMPWEAAWPGFARIFRQALIPTINAMNVMGLVTIPGQMTGQVLGGASPIRAARYQIIIMYLIVGGASISTFAISALTLQDIFDDNGRLATNRVRTQLALGIPQLFSPGAQASLSENTSLSQMLTSSKERPLQLIVNETIGKAANKTILELNFQGMVAGHRAVQVEMRLGSGSVACVMGPSGIGKSTILKMVNDLLPVDQESIMLFGADRRKMSPQMWRRQVLYVHQARVPIVGTPRSFIGNIQELKVNVAEAPFDPVPYLDAWGMPTTFLDRHWQDLPGGEFQRLMVAIALSTRPRVLLLDEPTSALDEPSKLQMEQSIRDLDLAVVFVTHDVHQARRIATAVWRLIE